MNKQFSLRALLVFLSLFAITAFLVSIPIESSRRLRKFHSLFDVSAHENNSYAVKIDRKLEPTELTFLLSFSRRICALEIADGLDKFPLRRFENLNILSVPYIDTSVIAELNSLSNLEKISVTDQEVSQEYLLKLVESCQNLNSLRGNLGIQPIDEVQKIRPEDKIWLFEDQSGLQRIELGFEKGARVTPIDENNKDDTKIKLGICLLYTSPSPRDRG